MKTASAVLIVAGALFGGDPGEPLLENRELSACRQDPTGCAIRSSWEIMANPMGNIRPSDASLEAPEELDRSVLGRRFSLLESWHRLDGAGFLVGNELGDQVLQEVPHGTSPENRNPATCVRLASPDSLPWRVFARLEQVDHFSDANLGRRVLLLHAPSLGSPWPHDRFAWFGENLPPYSLAGAGASWMSPNLYAQASYLHGWLWQHLPVSDILVPWRANRLDATLRWKSLRWNHLEQSLSRERGPGSVETSAGALAWTFDSPQILEAGIRYRTESARGAHETSVWSVGPWARHSLEAGGWRWAGFHRVDREGHLARDTVGWNGLRSRTRLSAELSAQWSDRPDGIRPELESALTGREIAESATEEHAYRIDLRVERPLGPLVLEASNTPMAAISPRAFVADSFDASGRWGRRASLDGILWGWDRQASLGWTPSEAFSVECAVVARYRWGDPAEQADMTPAKRAVSWSVRLANNSGLSLRTSLGWNSGTVVRNLSNRPATAGRGWSLDTWLRQRLFDDRLELSLTLADLLAGNEPDLPDGGQRRPRLLVAASWNL